MIQFENPVPVEFEVVQAEEKWHSEAEESNWGLQQGIERSQLIKISNPWFMWYFLKSQLISFSHINIDVIELQTTASKPPPALPISHAPSPHQNSWSNRSNRTPSPMSPTPSPAGSTGSLESRVSPPGVWNDICYSIITKTSLQLYICEETYVFF